MYFNNPFMSGRVIGSLLSVSIYIEDMHADCDAMILFCRMSTPRSLQGPFLGYVRRHLRRVAELILCMHNNCLESNPLSLYVAFLPGPIRCTGAQEAVSLVNPYPAHSSMPLSTPTLT